MVGKTFTMSAMARIAFCPLFLQIGVVSAQDQAEDEKALRLLYGGEEMISIATGKNQPISRAPAVATVITAEDIKEIGALDLDEVLETVPGLHVARNHQGYNPIYTIRGVYSPFNPQVLVLINGVPITNLFVGDRNQVWGGMPVESIARIEIIRGPGSALYGADAFAGVINITTKSRADIHGVEAGFRGGSASTYDGWLLYGGNLGGFDVAFTAEYITTDGQSRKIDADAQTALDEIFGTKVSLAPGSVNLDRESLDATLDIERGNWRLQAGLQSRRNVANGAGVAQALDSDNRYRSDRWRGNLTYHNPEIAADWDVKVELSYLDTSQELEKNTRLFPAGAVLPIGSDGNANIIDPAGIVLFSEGYIGNPEVWERHYRLEASGFYTGFEHHQLRFGAGYHLGDLYRVRETKNFGPGVVDGGGPVIDGALTDVSDTPFVFLDEGDRTDYFFFLQDVWSFARDWELTAGVRYDDYSDFGDTVNPRLALVWSARFDLTVKLLYGRAFRAPSFAELGNMNNPVAIGNPDLDPETMDSLELAFDYMPHESVSLALNLFAYRWDDIIEFVPDASAGGSQARNSGEQHSYGLELDADWRPLSGLRLLGNYALQKSTDEETHQNAGNAPIHHLYVRADWDFLPNWQLNGQLNWVGSRKRVAGDDRDDIDDYSIVDLNIRRKGRNDKWEVALLLKNLFDTDAREPSLAGNPVAPIPNDLPLPGRSVFGELRLRF